MRILALMLTLGNLALSATAMAGVPEAPVLDPPVPARTVDDAHVNASANITFVKNIPYPSGTDIEFGEFTVTKLDESGNPICVRDEAGQCVVDDNGNVVHETEQRDYAFAGAQSGPATRIVDITDPENAFVAATVNCSVSQADIQVRPDLGLLVIGVDSNTNACGMGGTQGIIIVDVSDPRSPQQLSVFKSARGAHNATFHPTQPLVYLSDSDVANTALGAIPIVDVSNPSSPTLVRTFVTGGVHSPHDIFFNAAGTRAYAASVSRTDIFNTSDPRNPSVVSSIYDPAINIHHDAQITPDGRTLVIGDEIAGAAAGLVCPGGGLHFYDITAEATPRKSGVFFAQTGPTVGLCTAHVFRIDPDGKTLTIGWYTGGTRVVDISDPTGVGAVEIGHMVPSGLGGNATAANSWASKKYKGYIYSNDRARGLDIMKWENEVPAATGSARSVVGVIDTGINPYHQEFRWDSPLAFEHPSTYIPGYPADAIALPITLDEPNYWSAVRRDCDLWRTVQDGKLYWFPGTKIIGGITYGGVAGMSNCTAANPTGGKILDTGGHGTMTASRVAANTYGACRECLLVAIQTTMTAGLGPANTQQYIDAIGFAGTNSSWIDAQSNSWGPIVFPAWEPTGQAGLFTSSPALVRAVEANAQKHPAFWASGNGIAGRGGILGSPTLATPSLTPSAISVGGFDSGYVNTWPGFPPHLASDTCRSWAATHRSTTQSGEGVGGGTSGATPFVAGGAMRVLMEARSLLGDTRTGVRTDGIVAEAAPGVTPPASGPLADGKLTVTELKDVVFKTATPKPVRQYEDGSVCNDPVGNNISLSTPVKWASIPGPVPTFWFLGYGAVDRPAVRLAFKVLRGEETMPVRTAEDAYFTGDRTIRSVTYEVYSRP